ncbi:MAG TPA: glycosyltransferase family 4 protein, partial [Acidobacteriaceae bacterium]|nr:glycosyltransferase family 4 protein [Acidobacteriaceae bacterium]
MRILMTTDTVGGVWTFTSELTQQLLQRGHSVHLVGFGRAPSGTQFLELREIEQNSDEDFAFTPSETALEWMQENERVLDEGQALLTRIASAFKPDLILSNQFCFGRLMTSVPRIVVAHSDVLSWARACKPSALEPTPWLNRYTSMVQAGLLDAAAVVTPTEWMGKALTASFFLPRNYHVIPNGVSVGPAPDPPPDRKFQAVTAGRLWDEAKGLDTLRDHNLPLSLLVAGENVFQSPEPNASWPGNLVSLGPLSPTTLHAAFRESSFYLCTSRYEPFGLAPLEAALCGCAVVCRDIPSLREVWGEGALYFSDNTSLAKIVQELGWDHQLLSQAQ